MAEDTKETKTDFTEQSMEWLAKKLSEKRVTTTAPGIRMALYGKPGVGKTVFGATLPKPIILAAEKGVLSIADKFKQLTVIDVTKYDDIRLALAYLQQDRGKTFASVVIDSLSEAQRKHMDDLLRVSEKSAPTLDLWMHNINEVRTMIRAFCDLPINVLLICSRREERDDETGGFHYTVGLSGKLAQEMPGYVDILGYMYTKTVGDELGRFILTEPTEKFDAKDRSGRLPRTIEDPDFGKIQQIVHTGPKREAKPKAATPAPKAVEAPHPAEPAASDAGDTPGLPLKE